MAVTFNSDLRPDGPRELASGIDSLTISLRGTLPEALATSLADAKATALEHKCPVEVELGHVVWQVQPGRFGKYPFSLRHEYGFLGVTDSLALPTMRWEPLATAIHALGPATIAYWLIDLVESEIGSVTTTLSRLDLHADFQGLFFRPEDKEAFVGRPRSCVANWDEGVFSGFTFGSRGSKSILARLYDKTLEIAKKGGTYWYEIWGDLYDPEETTWRVEFECHRAFLRKFGIITLEQGFASVGGVWKYATEEWLSLRIPTLDDTHSRWRIEPAWLAVQKALLASRTVSLERVRESRREDDLHRTIPQLNGWLARTGAILGLESADDVIKALPRIVEMYERSSDTLFNDRIQHKRKKMLLP